MFSYLKGVGRGRKLARQSALLSKDIVNFLIMKSFQIQLPDTAYIFQESYAMCYFVLMGRVKNAEEAGSMILTSRPILKDWLLKVFSLADSDYDFGESVEAVVTGLSEFSDEWMKELSENHTDLVGEDTYKWIPAASAQFIEHVDFYIYDKFRRSPDKFYAVLGAMVTERIKKLMSFWDKQKFVASLEAHIPEDWKKDLRNM